jgi:hypothetical protein
LKRSGLGVRERPADALAGLGVPSQEEDVHEQRAVHDALLHVHRTLERLLGKHKSRTRAASLAGTSTTLSPASSRRWQVVDSRAPPDVPEAAPMTLDLWGAPACQLEPPRAGGPPAT